MSAYASSDGPYSAGGCVLESASGRDGTTQAFHQKAQTAMSTWLVPVFLTQK